MNDSPSPKIFQRLQRLTDYEKLKKSYLSICKMIDEMKNREQSHNKPRNPREDLIQRYDNHSNIVWQRQKMNLEEKIRILENSIKKDIEDSKNEL